MGFQPRQWLWFAAMEQRLGHPPMGNQAENNVPRVAPGFGIAAQVIPRNVRGCWNIGYCGMGCPTGAKPKSMLVPPFRR